MPHNYDLIVDDNTTSVNFFAYNLVVTIYIVCGSAAYFYLAAANTGWKVLTYLTCWNNIIGLLAWCVKTTAVTIRIFHPRRDQQENFIDDDDIYGDGFIKLSRAVLVLVSLSHSASLGVAVVYWTFLMENNHFSGPLATHSYLLGHLFLV